MMVWSMITVMNGRLDIVKGNLNNVGHRDIIGAFCPIFVSGSQIMIAYLCMMELPATQTKVLKFIWRIMVSECLIGLETDQN